MPRNASGAYTLPAGTIITNGTVSNAVTQHNTPFSDVATALTDSLTAGGEKVWTGNQNANGAKIINLLAGTLRADSARLADIQDGNPSYAALTGTNTLTGTLAPALTAYVVGAVFRCKMGASPNSGAVTFNFNGVGAGAGTWPDGTALASGDLPANAMFEVQVASLAPTFHLLTQTRSLGTFATTAALQAATATLLSVNDAAAAPAATDRQVLYTAITVARTVTLPLANSVRGGTITEIKDGSGSASQTVTISIARSGADTIDGNAATQVCINIPRGSCFVMSDGGTGWHVLKWSVIYTNVASGDVSMSVAGDWYTGATISPGTLGTWEVTGGLALLATDAGQRLLGRLTDGTTNMASGLGSTSGASVAMSLHFSARIASPAAALTVQGNCPATTAGVIKFNTTGAAADTYIKATRVA